MSNIYSKLSNHLDNLPGGFPKTNSGVEIKLLRKLFLPEEAEVSLLLKTTPQNLNTISKKIPIDKERLSDILESMSKKGLIFRINNGCENTYVAAQFAIGIWEYQVNSLDEELINYFNEYFPTFSKKTWNKYKTKQLRVIPVHGSIKPNFNIMSYEKAGKIVKNQKKIVLAPCICRREHNMMGGNCEYLSEACFIFGKGADFYKLNGLGRSIAIEEAIKILKIGASSGLVLQAGNSQKPLNICMCCGCCCRVLKSIKLQENPSEEVNSNWFAVLRNKACVACKSCIDKCHMNAISLQKGKIIINHRLCIGCGVCVIQCKINNFKLVEKGSKKLWIPPKNTLETYSKIAKERGI